MKMTDKTHTKLLIRYANKIVLTEKPWVESYTYVASFLQSLQQLGYTLSAEAIEMVQHYNKDDITKLYTKVIGILKELTGASKNWKPMYPNFPQQVLDADSAELYYNAIMHYFGKYYLGAEILPEYEKDERFPLTEFTKLKVINVGTADDFHGIFKNLMQSPTSVSAEDMENVEWYINTYKDKAEFPETIPHKEMLSSVVKFCLVAKVDLNKLSSCAKTSTDVLRIAVAMSAGDVSLAAPTHFIKFNRAQRRFLLQCFENSSGNTIEDMASRREMWKRLGERLHPGEYATRYPKAAESFQVIRNSKIRTFNGDVETALEKGDVIKAADLLKTRPGVFARRMDHLLRISDKDERVKVLANFKEVASKISTPVLLQVKSHFSYRDPKKSRIVFPKGQVAKAKVLDAKLPKIPKTTCADMSAICESALMEIYSEKEDMGKVYIDPTLEGYLVPFSQRSASKALKTIARGSRLPLTTDKKAVRFFIWWKGSGVDIDLSSVFYDKDWNQVDHVSYTNLVTRRGEKYACHSGDIVTAPRGACEFIDVNMPLAKKEGVRYIAMCVYSFSQIPFVEMEECCAGWMERKEVQSGEIFEARTVQNRIDLTSDAKTVLPLFIDLQEGCVIWADMSLTGGYSLYNIESSGNNVKMMAESIVEMRRQNLYDLFRMHVAARKGTLVETKEEADQIFSVDEGITPFDFDKIAGEYI